MAKQLLIVESPAKARTIKKYLGKGFEVMASYGHVRDLRPKEGAVDPDDGFAMHYEVIEKSEKHVTAIVRAAKKAEEIYLATDPDREGEAISWHLVEILKERKALKDKVVRRVVFHEITKRAILEAMEAARDLATDLVNAQQARRALDYLVGFNLSPLLWKKIRRGLSAGRVQSPALRMIVEREEEIERFVAREYWTVEADLSRSEQAFLSKLHTYQGNKLSQFSLENEDQTLAVEKALRQHADGKLQVSEVKKRKRRRNPAPPFTTSTLQQEAARKLSFTAQRTMRVAQQLYEGIQTDDGPTGLITYMRTDSVNLAQEAVEEIRSFIASEYGAEDVPKSPRVFKTKAKNAQEAHEGVRPTSVLRRPGDLSAALTAEQLKLYSLIWKRAVACQMEVAVMDTVAVTLDCGEGNSFRAVGSTIVSAGFLKVYEEGSDNAPSASGKENRLPPLEKGDEVDLVEIRSIQHFTEPPPRFSEASLVKTLEEYEIGRPSTYASIISTLQQREYVTLEKRRFQPTDVGRVVSRFLTEHFTPYVDYKFTAGLEDELDAISRGEKAWKPVLDAFWGDFKKRVDDKAESVQRSDVTQEKMDEKCPRCSSPLSIRLGRRGRFIGCTAYPECTYTRNLGDDADGDNDEPEIVEGRQCPECESPLAVKRGRYGKFIGCTAYPKCKHMEPLEKPRDTGVLCPECSKANLLERKSRRGKVFYSCARYPECKYAVWNEPVAEPCPDCSWPLLTIKTTKRRGREKVCPQKECSYSLSLEDPAEESSS